MAQDVGVAIAGADPEAGVLRAVPLIEHLFHFVALLAEIYAASQVIAQPLPHGRGSAVDWEPRASASGLEPGAGMIGDN